MPNNLCFKHAKIVTNQRNNFKKLLNIKKKKKLQKI